MMDTGRRSLLLQAAISQGILHPVHSPLVSLIDWERLEKNVDHLMQAFPPEVSVQHTFAVKAGALVPVLRRLSHAGMGAEVASDGELTVALDAGVPSDAIVFDSPAKSWAELQRGLDLGIAINADNFQELSRIADILSTRESSSALGVRINPQVGAGSIAAMSTASEHSKFGIPLRDPGVRDKLLQAYCTYPWLTRVHAHVGSQGCPLPLIAQGLSELVSFADEVNHRVGWKQIDTLDIGGGLPVDFSTDEPLSKFEDYIAALQRGAPRLFSGDYSLITEFGRSILAKHGLIAACVEYTKEVGGRHIALTHAGAHVATRTVFMPESWPIRVEAFDSTGRPKSTAHSVVQDVAGPCCFAGDLVARGRELPQLEQGDIVALLDTGAYYASTPFQYNSLPLPGIYGASFDPAGVVFDTVRDGAAVPA